MRRLSLTVILLIASAGCDEPGSVTPDLERMIRQHRYQAYDPCELFADGRVMRSPPEDTVAQSDASLDPAVATGLIGGAYVDPIPLPVTRAFLARGQDRYNIYCAACHGIAGDGESWMARKMTLRIPPTLVGPTARAFLPGRIYQAVNEGYGLMRAYGEDLDQEDRWAVVAYVRALQLASSASLDALPPALRARAEEELR